MEPKGPLIDDVLHLRATWKIRDRVVIIDPRDIRVSVNIFDRGNGSDREPGFLGLGDGLALVREADADFYAAVLQVKRMGVALGAVADDRNFLAADEREVRVLVVVDFSHGSKNRYESCYYFVILIPR